MRRLRRRNVEVKKVTDKDVTVFLDIKTASPELLIDKNDVKVFIAFRGDPIVNVIRENIKVPRPTYDGYESSVGRIDYLRDNDSYFMEIKLQNDLVLKSWFLNKHTKEDNVYIHCSFLFK